MGAFCPPSFLVGLQPAADPWSARSLTCMLQAIAHALSPLRRPCRHLLAIRLCIIASFDRDKIPPPSLMRPDASFPPPKPVEDIDSGIKDASTGDGAVADGGLLDGAVLDGEVPLDGSVDAALTEAGIVTN